MHRRTFLATMGASSMAGPVAWSRVAPGDEVPPAKKPYRVIDTPLTLFNTHTKRPAGFEGLPYEMATAEATVDALRRGDVDKAFLISYTSVDIHQKMPKGIDPKSLLPLFSKDYC